MDFFDHQEQARKRTSLLLFYYVVAVVLIVLSIYTVIAVLFTMGGESQEPVAVTEALWNPELLLWVGLGTLLVVSIITRLFVWQTKSMTKLMLDNTFVPATNIHAILV